MTQARCLGELVPVKPAQTAFLTHARPVYADAVGQRCGTEASSFLKGKIGGAAKALDFPARVWLDEITGGWRWDTRLNCTHVTRSRIAP